MKTYRPWEPDRTYLLPPLTRDWLPDGHIAEFILDVLDELDLAAIEDRIQDRDPRGEKPYSPHMLVALLLYGYSIGLFSSRRLAQATWTDLGARADPRRAEAPRDSTAEDPGGEAGAGEGGRGRPSPGARAAGRAGAAGLRARARCARGSASWPAG